MTAPTIAAYVYPGWHPCPERDRRFRPGWSEWDLVLRAKPRFPGHNQPRIPQKGIYDDSSPETAAMQARLARAHGIDLLVYGFFWSRGKRVLYRALDEGFLGHGGGGDFPFSVMWANRMPRGVLPVKLKPERVIDPSRLVYTDRGDFLRLIRYLAENYFSRPSYFRIQGKPLLSIFDSTFFLRQMGCRNCRETVDRARQILENMGLGGLHLMAVNPAMALCEQFSDAGFDSITHYVHLPDWKGCYLQDYQTLTIKRKAEWKGFASTFGLPYFPSVSPGWDATPRGVMHSGRRPRRYPWWPVVTGESPDAFSRFLRDAVRFTLAENRPPMVFIASWNEWSEGHYLEPDTRFGSRWLEAVRQAL
ncbi:MAG TPA: hypothetical protein EYP57_02295 [Thermodesulfobacteriaceae bacterium]|nr:hypothetical protein [Thermodesulfobacteriaceae bacterium]